MGLAVLVCALGSSTSRGSGAQGQDWSVTSPNGEVVLSVQLGKGAGSQAPDRLTYRVEHGKAERAEVVSPSPLGLRLRDRDFMEGLRFEAAEGRKPVEESYTMPHGKRQQCRNRANQIALLFRNRNGQALRLELRAYDNGAAFRYILPGEPAVKATLLAEATGFALPAGARMWCAPSDKATTYSPGYETYYENEVEISTVASLGLGWSFPLLYRTGDSRHWGLITEANVDATFCGTRLSSAATNGVFTIVFPDPAEGHGQGSPEPASGLPWTMPWRVILVGSTLAGIVESTLVTDLSAPSAVADTGWIKPGRVAWSWWSDQPSPRSAAAQRKFVDLAVEMGWEYVLVDANWPIMENGNIHEVLEYAKAKGVDVLLWYNSGGPHNVVTEKPRDSLTYPEVRQFEFNLLKQWGVKGIKVDFFQSDKQDVIGLYHGLLQSAATNQIMLNFHGCTLPRGWERQHPHLMSMEAVRGEECYIFDPKYPAAAPVQNTILPFTRNAVGPMDYTPVGFSDNKYPHRTTYAHELALAVLFETGWLHLTDKVEAYQSLPPEPKGFLREVPVTWDDTRFVDGYPGKYAILARRKGDAWYVAGVNGEDRPREVVVKPGRLLLSGGYEVRTIADGDSARDFKSQTSQLAGGGEFRVNMLPYGGFTAVIRAAR
jgi:hypothetical protein